MWRSLGIMIRKVLWLRDICEKVGLRESEERNLRQKRQPFEEASCRGKERNGSVVREKQAGSREFHCNGGHNGVFMC